MSDIQQSFPKTTPKTKPIPKDYPRGFSFWETMEFGNAIEVAAEEAGINVSNWLRQTVRARLRHEGWVRRPPRMPGNHPNA